MKTLVPIKEKRFSDFLKENEHLIDELEIHNQNGEEINICDVPFDALVERCRVNAGFYDVEINNTQQELAEKICKAIKAMASDQNRLDNFESYLSHCFTKWFHNYITSPENLVSEFEQFATV